MVDRYELVPCDKDSESCRAIMAPHPAGDYVDFSAYSELLAEIDRLRAERTTWIESAAVITRSTAEGAKADQDEIRKLRAEVALLKEAGRRLLEGIDQVVEDEFEPFWQDDADALRALCAETETGTEEKGSK